MNGRRSDGFGSLNYNTGVKAGSLKGYTLYLLFLRTDADAGKTFPRLQVNLNDDNEDVEQKKARRQPRTRTGD